MKASTSLYSASSSNVTKFSPLALHASLAPLHVSPALSTLKYPADPDPIKDKILARFILKSLF
jgi:hypothetical protein